MSDIISRQAAIDAIKELCEHYTPTKSVTHPHMDFVIEELQNLPSSQPEIIHCKDCIRYHEPTCLMAYDGKEWSEDDGFCHVGERRTDE